MSAAAPETRYIRLQPCAAPDCPRQIRRHYLMCRDHWQRLKPETADSLYLAWGAIKRATNPQLSRRATGRFNLLMEVALQELAAAATTTTKP